MGTINNKTKFSLLGISLTLALAMIFAPSLVDATHVNAHNQAPGAIFTTTPDGGIVNENTHYTAKKEVYLDGGPPPNAPAGAAGLPVGDYVYQITDPSGKILLSDDPSKCRVLHVSVDGVVVSRVDPTILEASDGTLLGLSASWAGGACHEDDAPTPPTIAGPTDAGMSEQHDTNTDVDHFSDKDAIVIQMMPFFDTPNPGGVYKAWITPYDTYLDEGLNCDGFKGRAYKECTDDPTVMGAQDLLDSEQDMLKKKNKQLGWKPDQGFGPSNHESKTDNFKVVEERPPVPPEEFPMLHIIKFHDINADGIRDFANEPSIGPDDPNFLNPFATNICVDMDGEIVACPPGGTGGGFMIWVTDPNTQQNEHATPAWIVADVEGDWTILEHLFTAPPVEWVQSIVYVDDTPMGTDNPVTVTMPAASQDPVDVFVTFGNYIPVDIHAVKFLDEDADGVFDDEESGLVGVTITLTGTDGMGNAVDIPMDTDADGMVWWTGLKPGTYTLTETVPDGSVASTPTVVVIGTLESGDVSDDTEFGNYVPVDIHAVKFLDEDADGVFDDEESGLVGVTITLTGTDGMGGDVDIPMDTDADGMVWWTGLKPGTDYTLTETLPDGSINSTPTVVVIGTLVSGDVSDDTEFGNYVPVDIHGKKVIDDNGDGSITGDECPIVGTDPINNPGCEGVTVNLDGIDGMGVAVSTSTLTMLNGEFWFEDLKPGEYDVTIDEPSGFVCSFPDPCSYLDIVLTSGGVSNNNDFGDFKPVDIHAHKFFDVDESGDQQEGEDDLAGVLICLEDSDMNAVTEDLDGTPFPVVPGFPGCQFTDDDGLVWWTNLAPGEYTAFEDLDNSLIQGLFPVGPLTQTETLGSGETHTFEFANVGFCEGLTPGFWKNWRNHFSEGEMTAIIGTNTIAVDFDDVDDIFEFYNASDPQNVNNNILAVFILANQLTLNLTQLDPDNQFGTLFNACMIEGEDENLGFHLDMAVDMWEDIMDGNPPPAQDILDKKNILDAFANS